MSSDKSRKKGPSSNPDSKSSSRASSTARSNSRSNSESRPCSPYESPNKYKVLEAESIDSESHEEAWHCKLCSKLFDKPNDKVLECERCRSHFCIKCLNKKTAEYEILTTSDTMWFCVDCRIIVEKQIVTDLNIEKRCREIMENYEARITALEQNMSKKCDIKMAQDLIKDEVVKSENHQETKFKLLVVDELRKYENKQKNEKTQNEASIKQIVKEEINKVETKQVDTVSTTRNIQDMIHEEVEKLVQDSTAKDTSSLKAEKHTTVSEVVDEIQERKSRENNIIIKGFPECDSENSEERKTYERNFVQELGKACNTNIEDKNIKIARRIGKYDKENQKRPLLVIFRENDTKRCLFKNINKINKNEKYTNIRVCNDLTKEERENERKLWELAKDLREQDTSGDFTYKVRGPPWARRVVKTPIEEG